MSLLGYWVIGLLSYWNIRVRKYFSHPFLLKAVRRKQRKNPIKEEIRVN